MMSRNGWGATVADALTTAILMKLDDVVLRQLTFLQSVDFSVVGEEGSSIVSLFETTVRAATLFLDRTVYNEFGHNCAKIRYIGALISGYDLLKGPYSALIPAVSNIFCTTMTSPTMVMMYRTKFIW